MVSQETTLPKTTTCSPVPKASTLKICSLLKGTNLWGPPVRDPRGWCLQVAVGQDLAGVKADRLKKSQKIPGLSEKIYIYIEMFEVCV